MSVEQAGHRFRFNSWGVRHTKVVTILLMAILSVCGAFWLFRASTPNELLSKARRYESTDLRKALNYADSAIAESAGNFPAAQIVKCRVLSKLQLNAEANTVFQSIREPYDVPPDDLDDLAQSAMQARNFRLAADAVRAIGPESELRPEHLKLLIQAEYESGAYAETLSLARRYAKYAPQDSFPWLISASLHHEHNEIRLAVEAYQRALACHLPTQEENRVRFQVCRLALILGDISLSRQQLDAIELLKLDGQSKQALSLLTAEVLHREGRTQESISLLDPLVLDSGSVAARALRGCYRFEIGDLQGTIQDLMYVVQRDRFHQPAHYRLAQAYLKLGDPVTAEPYLSRSRELLALTARILTVENQLRNDMSNWQLRLQLADLNEKRGDRQAADQWRRSAERYQLRPTGRTQSTVMPTPVK